MIPPFHCPVGNDPCAGVIVQAPPHRTYSGQQCSLDFRAIPISRHAPPSLLISAPQHNTHLASRHNHHQCAERKVPAVEAALTRL